MCDSEELLALRARQLQLRDEDIEEVALRKKRIREEGRDTFNRTYRIRTDTINKKDVMLVYDSKRAIDMSSDTKLSFR